MDSADIFTYIVVPVLIFLSRVADVSIGTIRIIMISRGNKLIAPILGFFEITIWLIAMGQVMQNLTSVVCYIAYGTGFAFGNYVGIMIETKLAIGLQAVRIITDNKLHSLQMVLRDEGFAVTTVDAVGAKGPVNIIYTAVNRKEVNQVLEISKIFEPKAFITVEDIRSSYAGFFRPRPFRLTKKK